MKYFPYGLDAPGVVRNLALVGLCLGVPGALSLLGILPPALHLPFGRQALDIELGGFIWPALACLGMACWMIWSSAFGKIAERERLLDQIAWRGDENVLDVGCGRGLLLVGAAKRLSTGRARGVDLWRQQDLSSNSRDATLANARREGVAARVDVDTGDMQRLPYADGAFDVILSKAAIHNIDQAEGRDQAVREIARVLAPGGTVLIDDIRNLRRYGEVARDARLEVTLRMHPLSLVLWIMTFGSLRMGQMTARRVPGQPAL